MCNTPKSPHTYPRVYHGCNTHVEHMLVYFVMIGVDLQDVCFEWEGGVEGGGGRLS